MNEKFNSGIPNKKAMKIVRNSSLATKKIGYRFKNSEFYQMA
jgi:hypothetical protein